MPNRLQLEGRRFGRLTVEEYAGGGFWNVRCDCGNNKKMRTAAVKAAQSCGCIRTEKNREQGKKRRNKKICPVCGQEFYCSPSDKTITCSPECSSQRRTAVLTGRNRTAEEKTAIRQAAIKRGRPQSYDAFIAANAASPKCQRGEMHSAAKKWRIRYIETGEEHEFTNLAEWIRKNIDRFARKSENIDDDIKRISHCFYKIKSNLMHGRNCITYTGWQIIDFDNRKNCERGYK